MKQNRFHFFCPHKKVNTKIQTSIKITQDFKYNSSKDLELFSIQSMITHETKPQGQLLSHLVNSHFSQYTFFQINRANINFDPLGYFIPDAEPSITFEIREKELEIIANEKRYNYQMESQSSFLENLLQTGVITFEAREFFSIISQESWENGLILAKIVDTRISCGNNSYMIMKIRPDAYLIQHQNLNDSVQLLLEQKLALRVYPVVYTDSRKMISRFQSLMDQRKKMWICQIPKRVGLRDFQDDHEKSVTAKKMDESPLQSHVEIPCEFMEILQSQKFTQK